MNNWNLTEVYAFEGRYVRFGVSGNGPPVIVVHGTPWSWYNMRRIIEPLADNFTTYYFDLIGYGQSDRSNGDVSLGILNTLLDQLITAWVKRGHYVIDVARGTGERSRAAPPMRGVIHGLSLLSL